MPTARVSQGAPPMPKKSDNTIALDPVVEADLMVDEPLPTDDGNPANEPAKPKPKPGDAEFDWSAVYGPDVPLYIHTFSDGTVVALKTMNAIYNKTWLYKLRTAKTEVEVVVRSIERAGCAEALAVLDNLDDTAGDPIDELYTAWIRQSTSRGDGDEGLTPGN